MNYVLPDDNYTVQIKIGDACGLISLPTISKDELDIVSSALNNAVNVAYSRTKYQRLISKNVDADIDDLELSIRAFNVLKRAGCSTVKDVLSHTREEIQHFRNMGARTYDEIIKSVSRFGNFKGEEVEDE